MTTSIDIKVPSEQLDGTRSQVLRWLKAVGEPVTAHEPVVELETDKVTVEIAAPGSGVLGEILKVEGDNVEPGDLLGRIGSADSMPAAAPAPVGAAAAGAVTQAVAVAADATAPVHVAAHGPNAAKLSPAVRRLLAEHGLEASAVQGSGEGGRISAEDVLRHAAAGKAVAPELPATPAGELPAGRMVPHSAIRKRIAAHMADSLRTAPHVTTVFEADLGAVLAHRARHRADFEARGAPLTLTAYFVAACVAAIRAAPEANSRWTDDALELFDRIDIGIGTAVEGRGLVVPVIRDVAALDLFGIATRLGDLATRARADRLSPSDVRGGTFTISNHGVSGSLLAAPIIINQPQSAILGVGKLEKRVVVVERDGVDAVTIRPRCYVTLTLDHRVMDGHVANRFLQTLVTTLDHWAK